MRRLRRSDTAFASADLANQKKCRHVCTDTKFGPRTKISRRSKRPKRKAGALAKNRKAESARVRFRCSEPQVMTGGAGPCKGVLSCSCTILPGKALMRFIFAPRQRKLIARRPMTSLHQLPIPPHGHPSVPGAIHVQGRTCVAPRYGQFDASEASKLPSKRLEVARPGNRVLRCIVHRNELHSFSPSRQVRPCRRRAGVG